MARGGQFDKIGTIVWIPLLKFNLALLPLRGRAQLMEEIASAFGFMIANVDRVFYQTRAARQYYRDATKDATRL